MLSPEGSLDFCSQIGHDSRTMRTGSSPCDKAGSHNRRHWVEMPRSLPVLGSPDARDWRLPGDLAPVCEVLAGQPCAK